MKALVAIAIGSLVLAAAFGVLLVTRDGDTEPAYVGSRPPEGIMLPTFSLVDDEGRTVRSEDLRGKAVVVTFLDAQCTDACPIAGFELARAVDALTPEERADVAVLGISTDPAEDTPAAVDEYLRARRAKGRLRYLTAPLREMDPVWDAFNILPSVDTGDDSLHSIPIQIYDRDGEWRSTLNVAVDLSRRTLLHDIRLALGQ